MADARGADDGGTITIKKYANRRLYNTATSSYVTLEHLAQMVKEGKDFVVYDAKSGEDITRSVLTQIIFEEESKGHALLPIKFLRQLIALYGDSLQALVPSYLEVSMESFARNQEQMRDYVNKAFGGMFPFNQFEEVSRQNLNMFLQAMNLWSPFPGARTQGEAKTDEERAPAGQAEAKTEAEGEAASEDEIAELRDRLKAMERQLDALEKGQD